MARFHIEDENGAIWAYEVSDEEWAAAHQKAWEAQTEAMRQSGIVVENVRFTAEVPFPGSKGQ